MDNKIVSKIKSIDKACKIINIISDYKDGLSLSKMAKLMNLSSSSIHHILSSLINNGYMKQNEKTKKYKIGLKFTDISNKFLKNLSLYSISNPYLNKLLEQINEMIYLIKIDKTDFVVIETLNTSHNIRPFEVPLSKDALHATAVGKIFLSSLENNDIKERIQKSKLKKLTKNTITSFDKLMDEIKEIRLNNVAYDNEELEEGLSCVATPIFNFKGDIIASIVISIPKQRCTSSKKEEIVLNLKEASRKISRELVYPNRNNL
ncbi:MAG: IclR family transcriptional regulator [Actinobacteria bacterium]|nr:IclR family transcriptional regulator [Actinomycetota bacterium]